MELKAVTFHDFLRAMEWAANRSRKMLIREIKYEYNEKYEKERVIGEWYELKYGSRKLFWVDTIIFPTGFQNRMLQLDKAMRYRLDRFIGKAEIRNDKGLYLQIRIDIPDTL